MIESLNEKDKKVFTLIRNSIIHMGNSPTLREINELTGGKSPRSASIIIERLIKAGLIKKIGNKIKLSNLQLGTQSEITVKVPLVGTVPCGNPLLAQENIETYIPISTGL